MPRNVIAEDKARVSCVIEKELAARLKNVAEAYGMSVSQVVGNILKDCIAHEEDLAEAHRQRRVPWRVVDMPVETAPQRKEKLVHNADK